MGISAKHRSLSRVPANSKAPNKGIVAAAHAQLRSGPLPDPEELAGYERLIPGSADRIFKMAEKQQDHAIAMNLRDWRLKRTSAISSTLLGLAAIGVAYYMVYTGQPGASKVLYALAAVVTAVIGGRTIMARNRKSESSN